MPLRHSEHGVNAYPFERDATFEQGFRLPRHIAEPRRAPLPDMARFCNHYPGAVTSPHEPHHIAQWYEARVAVGERVPRHAHIPLIGPVIVDAYHAQVSGASAQFR